MIALNDYQKVQLRAYLEKHKADSDLVESWGWERYAEVADLRWFPCGVPGMVGVFDEHGYCCKLLYPTPRPVPRDPLFQHAKGVTRNGWMYYPKLNGRREFWDDWQWRDAMAMDAPDEMPAGGCYYFDSGEEDAYGAEQFTIYRE